MQLDLNAVATRLGMAILEKMAADVEVQQLEARVNQLTVERDSYKHLLGGEADGTNSEGDGNQGA